MSPLSKSFLSHASITQFFIRERVGESLQPSASSCATRGRAAMRSAARSASCLDIGAFYALLPHDLAAQRLRLLDQLTEPFGEVVLLFFFGQPFRARGHLQELIDER